LILLRILPKFTDFFANSPVKVKDFDVQKIDSGVLQTELCARAIRKRDGAGIAPYQQAC